MFKFFRAKNLIKSIAFTFGMWHAAPSYGAGVYDLLMQPDLTEEQQLHNDIDMHIPLEPGKNVLSCWSQVFNLLDALNGYYVVWISDFDSTFVEGDRKRSVEGKKTKKLTQTYLNFLINAFIKSGAGEFHFVTARKPSDENKRDIKEILDRFNVIVPVDNIHFSRGFYKSKKINKILKISLQGKDPEKCAFFFTENNEDVLNEAMVNAGLNLTHRYILFYLRNKDRNCGLPMRCQDVLSTLKLQDWLRFGMLPKFDRETFFF